MLKKRIYLPDNCLGQSCEHYASLKKNCKTCSIFKEDLAERTERLTEAHRKAARTYYHKNKNIRKKVKAKKIADKA